MNDNTIDIETALNKDTPEDAAAKRERSQVDFAYNDLDDGVSVARSLNEFSGNQGCDLSELAAHMGMTATGGGFRLKIAAARTFGLIQNEQRGRVQITGLGNRILKPETSSEAKVEAFLNVELYAKLYESRKGHALPQAAVLEREIVNFGVPPKQKAKARQVFERSAQQAGFIQSGTGRLVRPPLKENSYDQGAGNHAPPIDEDKSKNGGGGSGGGFDGLHPFIIGLLGTLPEPETNWPYSKRKEWLNAAEQIFKLIYKSSESEVREI